MYKIEYNTINIFDSETLKSKFREFKHPDVVVERSKIVPNQKALIAKTFIPANSIIFTYSAEASQLRTRTSIQVDKLHHLEAGNFGSYTNHSCQPNSVIRTAFIAETNTAKVALITYKNIAKDEEITFDYATTETDLTQALKKTKCLCKAPQCRKIVQSFNDLTLSDKMALYEKELLSDHILHIFNS